MSVHDSALEAMYHVKGVGKVTILKVSVKLGVIIEVPTANRTHWWLKETVSNAAM